MAPPDAAFWSDRLRRTLERYDEPLLRKVAARLIKPRNQWPVEELLERCSATADNPAVLDRRLQEMDAAPRQLLALMARSRQPRWNLGNLVELAMSLGQQDGLKPVFALLEAGLLFPADGESVRSFEQWLAASGGGGRAVFTHPLIASRALHEPLPLPDLREEGVSDTSEKRGARGTARFDDASLTAANEADGIEWLLRLAVLWQQVAESPLRRTIQGGFFKRDGERLGQDPLLTTPPADQRADVPDLGFFLAELAEREGLLHGDDTEVRAGTFPDAWDAGLGAAIESLWRNLFCLRGWNPLDGWRGEEAAGNPFPSAYLLAFLLLARLPEDAWLSPAAIEKWLLAHHPYWQSDDLRPSRQKPWLESFLLGVAYPLRLISVQPMDTALVRLTRTGRWLLGFADEPALETVFPKTLLVQPNLEIIAYRQGLTPELIGRLTRFANWKSLGAACTLQLEPASVYRGLESGLSFETMRLTLEQHGTRAVPPAVIDALRTWSNKRDRITVFPSATLLEFTTPDDLTEALARGLQAMCISDTMAVVASEEQIDFSGFRLSGTRDYALPPEKCVSVEPDGVTLTVDQQRSDLLLETDLPRFSIPQGAAVNGKRQYRLTPESLAAARDSGMTLTTLETWFTQRTGFPLPPAAHLLMTAAQLPPPRFQRQLVLHVATEEIADGLLQWPQTRSLIEARLGPTTLAVAESNAAPLRERLRAMGVMVADLLA